MNASNDMTERKDMLQQALLSQRRMIARHTGKAPEEIPQAFTPYKEVLDVYDKGLDLPDDVTIIWPDDNYGYMKRLSRRTETGRALGSVLSCIISGKTTRPSVDAHSLSYSNVRGTEKSLRHDSRPHMAS